MRVQGLNFIPRSYNFSEMSPEQVEKLSEQNAKDENFDREYTILKMLYCLKSDKERCVLLFELLREYGYQFDYRSLAKAVKIELRWYMRVKEQMRKRIRQGLGHISEE